MPIQISLNNRQQQVLGATVRQYIATARPVGSEALVEGFQPRVSPATIRNVMGYLEKAGLLYQPHTSAGRIPSDSGYRVYVDQLVTPSEQLAKQADRLLAHQLDVEGWTVEAILHGAACGPSSRCTVLLV
jgi:heat-inducible transcriptional repressor